MCDDVMAITQDNEAIAELCRPDADLLSASEVSAAVGFNPKSTQIYQFIHGNRRVTPLMCNRILQHILARALP